MLSAVLSKSTCADCRFCCSFRRKSLWETPLLPGEFKKAHPTGVSGEPVIYKAYEYSDGDVNIPYSQTDLTGLYRTDDPEEEVPCPFLDIKKGCALSEKDKPFDCKIWPLRIMRMPDGRTNICLTPTCPAINEVGPERMKALVKDGLGEKIRAFAKENPYIVKDYVEGFIVLD